MFIIAQKLQLRTSNRHYHKMRGFCILIFFLFPLWSLGKNSADSLFIKGNKAYAAGQYDQAIGCYQSIMHSGYESAALYFNLGNSYYKKGDIPSALLFLEKAHKLKPGDEDIRSNIRFVNTKTTDKIESEPEFFLNQWWRSIYLYFSLNSLAILTTVLALSGFILLINFIFSGSIRVRRYSFYIALVFIAAGLLTFFIAVQQELYLNARKHAIIFHNPVMVKSEPADKSKDLFIIHSGAKVNILDFQHNWMKIALPNGQVGWILAEYAKQI
jgi:tetratricopeptide (TPR) repeat protein